MRSDLPAPDPATRVDGLPPRVILDQREALDLLIAQVRHGDDCTSSDLADRLIRGGVAAIFQEPVPDEEADYQAACGSWWCRAPECKPKGL